MGFATDKDDALNLEPVKAGGWEGILKNWNSGRAGVTALGRHAAAGVLDPRLTPPTGVSDWETCSVGETCAEIAEKKNVTAGDRWNLLEACGLVPYESGKPKKPRAERSAVIKYPRPGQ